MKLRTLLAITTIAALGFGCSSDPEDEAPDQNGKPAGPSTGNGAQIPEGCATFLPPSEDDYASIQEALLDAKSGDTICFAEGRFELHQELSLAVSGVTLRGTQGTVLDFTKQTEGKNGLHVTGNDTVIEALRIENTPGDGIRATAVDGLTIRGVHVEWTWGPRAENGGYGIYPVQSSRILIEDSFVSGASDTGIYVGQSNRIIVRNNEATKNVAGIEIENSTDADVYDNYLYGNTSGILVFNLPHLEIKDGRRAKVHHNRIEDNNLHNFAPKGNIVGLVPSGTGILVMAADDNEIHDNIIKKHQSLGIAIINWAMTGRDDPEDSGFDFFPEGNYVHSNTVEESGYDPKDDAHMIALVLGQETLEDIVWDGVTNPDKEGDESLANCFENNGDASFLNIKAESTDITPYECSHPALPAVEL